MIRDRWERITWIVSTVLTLVLGTQIPPILTPRPAPTTPPIVDPSLPPLVPVPIPPAPEPPPAIPDPMNAILKLRLGNSGCTAVTIGGLRDVTGVAAVTAAHCVASIGQQGTVITKDGKTYKVTVIRIDRRSDCALLQISTSDVLPFAKIATQLPAQGTGVWHAGYGIDRPGNTENGRVVTPEGQGGQTQFTLSVSSGDSGGPIFNAQTGEVLSVVCCANRVNTWGASCLSINRLVGIQSWVVEE